MTIGIMGAMSEEITPLLEMYDEYENIEIGGNVYYKISYKNAQIIIAYSKIGKVHAAITASVMILKFGCEKIIFSGVAGGLNKDLKVGDLLLATSLCQHDVDITAFGHALILQKKSRKQWILQLEKALWQVAINLLLARHIKIPLLKSFMP